MANTAVIKVTIPTNGGEVFYFKPKRGVYEYEIYVTTPTNSGKTPYFKNKKGIYKYKYVDNLYYNESDFEHLIGYDFAMFLYDKFEKIYDKETLLHSTVEFIEDLDIEEIDY